MIGAYLLCAITGAFLLVGDFIAACYGRLPLYLIEGFAVLGVLLLGGSAVLTTEW